MVIPRRKPDWVLIERDEGLSNTYWFEEMIHVQRELPDYNSCTYKIRYVNDQIEYKDKENDGKWHKDTVKGVTEAYENWVADSILLDL